MLGVEQEQHQGIRTRGAEGGHIGRVECDPQGLKLEDRIERKYADRECDEDKHCPRRALVHMLEQDVQRHGHADKECRIQQVGDDAHADKAGVRDYVPGRGRRVAGNVHLGIHKSLGKAAEDADEQVENAGESGEALG